MRDALSLLDLTAVLLIAYGPTLALVRSALYPAAYELRYLSWLKSRPQSEDMREAGFRFLIGGPALLWAAYRADLWLLWLVLGVFVILGGLMCIWVSSMEVARAHQTDWSVFDEPAASHARRRRITQLMQLAFLAAWIFSWRGLAA